MSILTYPTTLTIEHTKSTSSNGSTHVFTIHAPTGDVLYALETESKHVQRVIKFTTLAEHQRKEVLAKIEWRGNGRDLVQMHMGDGDGTPVQIKTVWDPPTVGERYVESFTGADGEKYTWSKVVIGAGKEGVLEAHLTRSSSPSPVAKHTSPKHPDVPHTLAFGLPSKSATGVAGAASTLELSEASEAAGEMLFVTFLVALGRARASTAFTVKGFLGGAVNTWTRNMLGM